MSGINDFVAKFATVNGSGSASANTIFAKTLFRMGIPVSPKNIFPSNIQGLPTWYEVRVSEAGYLARRDGIDLMVAMNPQTFKEDLAEVVPGGWLFYDSTMPRIWPRDDISFRRADAEMRTSGATRASANAQEHGLRRSLTACSTSTFEVLRARPATSLGGNSSPPPATVARAVRAQHFDRLPPIKVPRRGRKGQDPVPATGCQPGAVCAGATVRVVSITPRPRCRGPRSTRDACATKEAASSTAGRGRWQPSASPSAAGTGRSHIPPAPASRR
jgi:Pyruvate/2-oxoacid:ferredoxin oxidoreductase gamma subunit